MSILASQQWWIRTDGNELNGGGFDPTISGAGVNYSDQASPQLSLTDIVTIGTTTVTSVTGGFTSNMIGNILRLAGDGYYMVTTRTNTNTITVDRATGTGTGQSGRIGGAWADFRNCSIGGPGTAPLLSNPVVPGNIVNVRGTGGNDPSSADYTHDGYYDLVIGDTSVGMVSFIGYNGVPCITGSVDNLIFNLLTWTRWTGIKWLSTLASPVIPNYGFITGAGDQNIYNTLINCILDQAGNDVTMVNGDGIGPFYFIDCVIKGAGSASGSYIAIRNFGSSHTIIGTIIRDLRCLHAFGDTDGGGGRVVIENSIITRCHGVGLMLNGNGILGTFIRSTVIDSCSDDSIRIQDTNTVLGAVITGCCLTNNGGYGINISSGVATAINDALLPIVDANNYYNNSSGARNKLSAGTNDKAVDPQYVNASSNDFTPQNMALKGAAIPLTIGAAINYAWIGPITPNSGGGSTTVVLPGIFGG